MSKIAIIVTCLFISCSQRDLSTPLNRLIGHWVRYDYVEEQLNENDELVKLNKPEIREVHFYFEPSDETTGFYTVISGKQSDTNRIKYEILKEIVPINEINIIINEGLIWKCHIPPTGKMLIVTSRDFFLSQEFDIELSFIDTLLYIDHKTKP